MLTLPAHSHLLHRQAYVYVAILGVVLPLVLGFAWALLLYFFAGVIIYLLLALLVACMLALTIWLTSKTEWFDAMSEEGLYGSRACRACRACNGL